LEVGTFDCDHVGVGEGGAHAFAEEFLFSGVICAEPAFGDLFCFAAKRGVGSDLFFAQFAEPAEDVNGEIKPTIATFEVCHVLTFYL